MPASPPACLPDEKKLDQLSPCAQEPHDMTSQLTTRLECVLHFVERKNPNKTARCKFQECHHLGSFRIPVTQLDERITCRLTFPRDYTCSQTICQSQPSWANTERGLCGSRKYPYPHHEGNWKFQREGGVKDSGNSRGVGGCMVDLVSRGILMQYVFGCRSGCSNIISYLLSITFT